MLNTFVGFTASVFSATYIAHEIETGRLTPTHLRFYHAMYQFLLFSMNLALVANNIGLMWVAIELATLTTVLMVGVYRTPESIEAAWKYFILGSVGIALALFGTILVYMAARPVVGEGVQGMLWTTLIDHAPAFDPASAQPRLRAFSCSATGRRSGSRRCTPGCPTRTRKGRRRSRPCSRACSSMWRSTPCCASSSCSTPMRARSRPGPLMVTLGLVSVVFAAFMLYRRRDVKRMFAYSSIEHMGVIVFAFGVGGPLANFAALLHMAMHSLTKSAIFYTVGQIAQVKGTQRMADIRGLTVTHPLLGWSLVFGVFAIVGLPPMGVFMSEFLIVSSTFERAPWLALPLAFGLLIALGALILRLQGMAFGAPTGSTEPAKASAAPIIAHFALVLMAGVYLPSPLVTWFQHVARHAALKGTPCARAIGQSTLGDCGDLAGRGARLGRGRRDVREPMGGREPNAHGADQGRRRRSRFSISPVTTERFPRWRRSMLRRVDSSARPAISLDLPRPMLQTRDAGSITADGPCVIRLGGPIAHDGAADAYAFLGAQGAGLHQIPVGPVHAGIIEPGHFRFHASGEAVVRLEERLGYVHKGIDSLTRGASIERAAILAARVSGDSTVAYSVAFARAVEAALGTEAPARAHGLRGLMAELERLANHFGDIGAILQRRRLFVDARPLRRVARADLARG